MPYRPRRVTPRPRWELTPLQLLELCTGHAFFAGEELPAEELAPAWASVRQPVLALYTQRCPGCRPWAWWVCDAPEGRECLDGAHDARRRDSYITRHHEGRLWYGRPGVYACPQCWVERYENQSRYLRRLELLLPAEEPVIPQDLAACDAWALERYEDDAVGPWEAGAALEGSEKLLIELGGRL